MQVLEVLKQGMATELWGMRFYEQAAARTTSPQGKQVFETLVQEEQSHLNIICGQYAAISSGEGCVSAERAQELAETVDPKAIFPEAATADELIPPETTDEQALTMAMEFETKGYNLYEQAAKETTAEDVKAMWTWLAKAEDKHYAYLQETYDYLVNNGVWYFDDQEFPIFEG